MSTLPTIGERVLVKRDAGGHPAEAEIVAHNFHRPHLVKVSYARSGTCAGIARASIAGPARAQEGGDWTYAVGKLAACRAGHSPASPA